MKKNRKLTALILTVILGGCTEPAETGETGETAPQWSYIDQSENEKIIREIVREWF